MARPFSPEVYDDLLTRACCPADNHDRETRVIVHSPGFYEGPPYGIGSAVTACLKWCAEDVAKVVAAQYGGAQVKAFGR